MKKILILLLAAITMSSVAQVKLKHGLILGGGGGFISNSKYTIDDAYWDGTRTLKDGFANYGYNAMLGYKFRLKPVAHKAFYDIDLNLVIKSIGYSITSLPIVEESQSSWIAGWKPGLDISTYCASVAFSYNYSTRKGMYVGAGIEPLYRFRISGSYKGGEMPSSKKNFDIPIFIKMGYDFKGLDLSVSFKRGITGMLEGKYVKNGQVCDLQFQLFIPF